MQKLLDTAWPYIELWGAKLLVVVALGLLFWIVMGLTSKAVSRLAKRFALDASLARFMQKTLRVILLILAAVTILGTLGVNVSAVVAGLGLTGFALGFALKDTIANLLSGIMILLYRPFRTGDAISVAGYEGVVRTIDLRYTELRHDNQRILIPNSKLFTDPVTVISAQATPAQASNERSDIISGPDNGG